MRLRALFVAGFFAVSCLLLAASTVPAASRGAGCSPRGSAALLATTQARVYSLPVRGEPGLRRVFGCRLSVGRPVALGEDPDRDPTGIYHLRLAGRYVGFSFVDCGASCSSAVLVYDLEQRRKKVSEPGVPPAAALDDDSVADLELSNRGAVAWIGEASGEEDNSARFRAVYAVDAGGKRTLDSGVDVVRDSLAISGRRVYWLKGTTPSAANLR